MSKRLEVKDLINIGLFSVLGFIFMMIGSFLAMVPVLMPVVPFAQGVLVGPVNMLYSTKIKKRGMIFIQSLLIALIYVAMGHGPWALLTAVIAGIIAEIILKSGEYTNVKKARLAFSIAPLCTLGNWLPIFISRNEYIKQMLEQGYDQEFIDKMLSVMPNWIIVVMAIVGIIGAYIGCSIGMAFLKNTLKKPVWKNKISWRVRMIIKLDFRTKLFMTIVLSYVMVLGNIQTKYFVQAILISTIPIILLINAKYIRVAIIGVATLLFVYAADKFLIGLNYNPVVAILLIIVMVIKKILPAFLMGRYTILTSNVGESIYSLKKMKCPDEIAIPLTVMVRFFYAARIDYSHIKKAMRLRGLTLKKLIKSPILLFEYRLVPLLMCLSKAADDLTVSAMTKGLAVNQKRTSISETYMGLVDFMFFLIMAWIIYLYIRGKYA